MAKDNNFFQVEPIRFKFVGLVVSIFKSYNFGSICYLISYFLSQLKLVAPLGELRYTGTLICLWGGGLESNYLSAELKSKHMPAAPVL